MPQSGKSGGKTDHNMPDESNEQFKEFQEIVSEDMDDFEERLDEIKTDISLLKNGSLDFDTNVKDFSEKIIVVFF